MRYRFVGFKYPKYSINKLIINETGQQIVCIDCKREVQSGDLLMGVSGATQSNTTHKNNLG